MNIAIIPARIGSKRIRKKNIRKFNGKPIIEYTIELLIKMKLFNKIIISSDSTKILRLLDKYKKFSICEPFLRSKKLGGNLIGTRAVIIDVLKKNNLNKKYNIFCVYPTSIFLKKKYINQSLKLIKNKKTDYVFSAKMVDRNLLRSFTYKKKKVALLFKQNYKKRTQDLNKIYVDAAQFYLAKCYTWLKNDKIFSPKSSIIEIGKYDSIDIDEIGDWLFAEKLYKIINK